MNSKSLVNVSKLLNPRTVGQTSDYTFTVILMNIMTLTVANIKDIIFKRREVEGITEMNIWKVELDLKVIEDILPKMNLKNLTLGEKEKQLRICSKKLLSYLVIFALPFHFISAQVLDNLKKRPKMTLPDSKSLKEHIDKELPKNLKIPVTQYEFDIILSTDVRDPCDASNLKNLISS
ncbi:hypothetical protein C1645_817360 [Glomus cerebriforme]|uniref:Uncharacterized protein n=1 Tax=Glomus cerebriforme TaxID=658196 RepID=A0A397T9F3_9GLOM|nr:hypothetical protein C1645_817360 [Glomus cerebriforme]